MKAAKIVCSVWLALLAAFYTTPAASAADAECRVGTVPYESLDAAAKAVMSGTAAGEIVLLADCTLDVGEISAPVTIDGAGHSVTVAAQSGTDSGALSISSALSFKNTAVSFANPKSWSAVIGSNGVLALSQGSDCSFRVCGIYTSPGAAVTLDASKMSLENMEYTCMMAEAYATLTLKNGSEFLISKPIGINGITGFNIEADASRFSVRDCARQGLVKCSLLLSNGAVADISSNGYGYNMYSGNMLSVDDGCSLRMNDNSTGAILMQGRSTVNIKSGGSFECRYNGAAWSPEQSDADYGSKAAVNVGWFNAQYVYTSGSFNAADGAALVISDNYARGISNYGTVYLGSGSHLTGNGSLLDGEQTQRVQRGGGLLNEGTLTLAQGAAVYNNHAAVAADDIVNIGASSLSLPATGSSWRLSDCGCAITGWFQDKTDSRWNVHGEGAVFAEEQAPGQYLEELELKAAHGTAVPPPTADRSELWIWLTPLTASAALLSAAVAALRRPRHSR